MLYLVALEDVGIHRNEVAGSCELPDVSAEH